MITTIPGKLTGGSGFGQLLPTSILKGRACGVSELKKVDESGAEVCKQLPASKPAELGAEQRSKEFKNYPGSFNFQRGQSQ